MIEKRELATQLGDLIESRLPRDLRACALISVDRDIGITVKRKGLGSYFSFSCVARVFDHHRTVELFDPAFIDFFRMVGREYEALSGQSVSLVVVEGETAYER